MLDIDRMSENEIIALLHNEQQLKKIILGKTKGFVNGEEQPITLGHLFERISPTNQNNDLQININQIAKLIAEHAQQYFQISSNNQDEKTSIILESVYKPLVNLINKMSINRAQELISTDNIRELLINPNIKSEITMTAIRWIDKKSVLDNLIEYVKFLLLESQKDKYVNSSILKSLNEIIRLNQNQSILKQYYEKQYQSKNDQAKNNFAKISYYKVILDFIKLQAKEKDSIRQEQTTEKIIQQNIEKYENTSPQLYNKRR